MEPINLHEYETLARLCLEPSTWDYCQGGSDGELTLRANSAGYERFRLRPRVLVDVSKCELATTVLGIPIGMPIGIAPLGCQCLAHPEGERATARGAGMAETLMIASAMATCSLEQIAQAASAPLWFQIYAYRDRRISETLIRRAAATGYQAIVLTVDTPRLGNRERDRRNGFGMPASLRFANFDEHEDNQAIARKPGESAIAGHADANFDASLTWEVVCWLQSVTSLPIVLKGVLTGEDARLAAAHGVAGIIVSNHGGRQLDSGLSTIEALPGIAQAVAGQCEIYLDGGIRRGTDVLKALALGARAVFVGRPILWGLAAGAEAGVCHVLKLLRAELELAMALAGRPTIESIDRSLILTV